MDERVLGQLALERGWLTREQLQEALTIAATEGRPLASALIRENLLTPDQLAQLMRMPSEGTILGKYRLVRRIGEGAMGEVWLAEDTGLGRQVAVKILVRVSRTDLERFTREARLAAKLQHPNIVQVYEMGLADNRHYIVMQYVRGKSLETMSLEPRRALEIMAEIADAVQYAHDQGVIHRDIKPGNLLMGEDGRVYLTDFGLAKGLESPELTTSRTGAILGTPAYMCPEMARGNVHEVGRKGDIYSLGATLYYLLAGQEPFQGKNLYEVLQKVANAEAVPLRRHSSKIATDIETIVGKAMAKESWRRYESAGDFAADIRRFLRGEAILARPASLAYLLYRRVKRNPMAWGLAVLLLIAGFATLALWSLREKDQARLEAERKAAIEFMRDTARVSVQGALELRREGQTKAMRRFLPALQSAYHGARERAPDLAEIEYLMGRMHRALMEDDRALAHQQEALRLDPHYLPAVYERAVLLSKRYGADLAEAILALRSATPNTTWTLERVEAERPELKRWRDTIIEDCKRLAQNEAVRGILAYHRGNTMEARRLLEKAVAADPLLEEAWETLAAAVWTEAETAVGDAKLRLWREAESHLTRAREHDKGYIPHVLLLGAVRMNRGIFRLQRGQDPLQDWKLAEQDFSEAIRLDPTWMEGRRGRASTLRNQGTYLFQVGKDPMPAWDAAERDYAEALRLKPDAASVYIDRGMLRGNRGVYRGRMGQDPQGDYAAAEADLTKGIELRGTSVEAWYARGGVRMNRGNYVRDRGGDPSRDYDEAQQDLSEALKLDPTRVEVWMTRADTRVARANYLGSRGKDSFGEMQEAERDLGEALKVDGGRADVWARRGLVRFNRGNALEDMGRDPLPVWTEAERDLAQALKLNPNLFESWIWLGNVWTNRGIYEKSTAHLEQAVSAFASAIELNGQSAEARMKRGAARLNIARLLMEAQKDPRQQFKEAERDLNAALGIHPKMDDALVTRGDLLTNRGLYLALLGADPLPDWNGAERDFTSALTINPHNLEALAHRGTLRRNFGIFYERARNWEESRLWFSAAAADFAEAIRLNPALERIHGETLKECRSRPGKPQY